MVFRATRSEPNIGFTPLLKRRFIYLFIKQRITAVIMHWYLAISVGDMTVVT